MSLAPRASGLTVSLVPEEKLPWPAPTVRRSNDYAEEAVLTTTRVGHNGSTGQGMYLKEVLAPQLVPNTPEGATYGAPWSGARTLTHMLSTVEFSRNCPFGPLRLSGSCHYAGAVGLEPTTFDFGDRRSTS